MPIYTETKTPYEFLVRWGTNGVLQGAHVQFLECTFKDGVLLASEVKPAQVVALVEGDAGFNLQAIIGQLAIDQQKLIDTQRAEIEGRQALIESQQGLINDQQAQIDALHEQLKGGS